MANIIRAVFNCNEYSTTAARPDGKPIYQYNYGQILQIHGLDLPKAVEIHFSHSMGGSDAIIRIGTTTDKVTEVAVPEKFLEAYGTVTTYIYVSDTESGQTEYKIQFQIAQRAKPEAWDSPEDGELFQEAIEAVNESADKAEDAAARAEEAAGKAEQSAQDAEASATAAKTSETTVKNLTDGFSETVDNAKVDITNHATQEKEQAISTIKSQGEEVQEDIAESVNTANAAKSELDVSIDNAETTVETVETATETAQTVESGLGVTIGGANTAKTELDGAISRGESVKSGLDTSITTGTRLSTDINASIDTANTAKTELDGAIAEIDTTKTEAVQAVEQEGAAQIQSLVDAGGGLENAINHYYALRRTGKVYETKIYKFNANPTSTGEKLGANSGLVCEPSTDTVEGRDDYENIPLFQWVDVNYIRDKNGDPHPTAIKGQSGYKETGAVDVGVMQMSFWIKIDSSNPEYDIWAISNLPKEGFVPYTNAVRPDGSVAPYIIHSKYVSGIASDGFLRSQPGLKPERNQSHNNMITNYAKKGEGYQGAGAERNLFQLIFQVIKYATKNSQSVFQGCTSHVFQYPASIVRSTSDTYFPVTNAWAANIIVGAYVSVGYGANNSGTVNNDRGVTTIHAYADDVKVLKVETLDDNNKAVYLDVTTGFSTTPVDVSGISAPVTITSMHYHSGSTDNVIGHHDGSVMSNSAGKTPYRIQGVEYAVGGYIIASDTVMEFQPDYSKNVYCASKGQKHTSSESAIRSTYKLIGNVPATANGGDYWIGDIGINFDAGSWYPAVIGSGNTQGWADMQYSGGANTSGFREYPQNGHLMSSPSAGSVCLNGSNTLSGANWLHLSCD